MNSNQIETDSDILSNELGIFAYNEKGFIRVHGTKDEPWFNGKDIASILGYKDQKQAIRKNVDDDDKNILKNLGGLGDTPNISSHNSVWINESGLYSLILSQIE